MNEKVTNEMKSIHKTTPIAEPIQNTVSFSSDLPQAFIKIDLGMKEVIFIRIAYIGRIFLRSNTNSIKVLIFRVLKLD